MQNPPPPPSPWFPSFPTMMHHLSSLPASPHPSIPPSLSARAPLHFLCRACPLTSARSPPVLPSAFPSPVRWPRSPPPDACSADSTGGQYNANSVNIDRFAEAGTPTTGTYIDVWIVGEWDWESLEENITILLQHAHLMQQVRIPNHHAPLPPPLPPPPPHPPHPLLHLHPLCFHPTFASAHPTRCPPPSPHALSRK